MNLEDRIAAFGKLGNYLSAIDGIDLENLINNARNENSWFTDESIKLALSGVRRYLAPENLQHWTSSYKLSPSQPRNVAVVMAGNIPLVGFHDFLSVLISGHNLIFKPSSKDTVLLKFIINQLTEIEPRFKSVINWSEQFRNFDAVIATGSNNSSRYFHYYFGKYPHIIRQNRTSCAILSGFESDEELKALGADVFSYFGLGCRNVSKVYIPNEYDLTHLLKSWESFNGVIHHHKYQNNYDYQKSIMLVNKVPFLDNGFVLLQENERLSSPIAVVYYEFYSDWNSLLEKINIERQKIQCVVGNVKPATVNLGQAQSPELWDYADQIDTLKFLDGLD